MANPANDEAKLKTAEAVAGSAGGGFKRCFPPTPEAMTSVIKTGHQDIRSYLYNSLTFKNNHHE